MNGTNAVKARRTHCVRREQEDEGGTNTGTMVSDTVRTPSHWVRHVSPGRNGTRGKLIEWVQQIRGTGGEGGREREAFGIREDIKVESRQGQRTAGRGLAQIRLVQTCHLFPTVLTLKNLDKLGYGNQLDPCEVIEREIYENLQMETFKWAK